MIDMSTFDNPWIRVTRRLSTGNGVVLLDGEPLMCAARLSPRQEHFLRNDSVKIWACCVPKLAPSSKIIQTCSEF